MKNPESNHSPTKPTDTSVATLDLRGYSPAPVFIPPSVVHISADLARGPGKHIHDYLG